MIDDHCTPDGPKSFSAGWAENEASGRQKMINSGEPILYKPTEEEVAMWHNAAAPLVDQWQADVMAHGGDPDAIYKAYVEALNRHDSRY